MRVCCRRVSSGGSKLYTLRSTLLNCLVHDGIGAALLQGLQRKLVTVERVALESQEDAARGAVAAVGCDARMLLIELV